MVSAGLQQLFDLGAFFSAPASSRKFRPRATNQKVGSSNLLTSTIYKVVRRVRSEDILLRKLLLRQFDQATMLVSSVTL